jgi:hypothetical protein
MTKKKRKSQRQTTRRRPKKPETARSQVAILDPLSGEQLTASVSFEPNNLAR